MSPILPEGPRCRRLGDGKRCSLEDLAPIGRLLLHMLEGPFPAKVFSNQCLGLPLLGSSFRHMCMTHSPPANLDSAGEKKSGKKHVVRLLTLSHTCYFQLRTPIIGAQTPVNMTALSRVHFPLDSPGRPLTQEYGVHFPNPCPTFPAPSSI